MVLALCRRDGLLQIMLLLPPKIGLLLAPKPMRLFREAVSRAVMVSELYIGQHGHWKEEAWTWEMLSEMGRKAAL